MKTLKSVKEIIETSRLVALLSFLFGSLILLFFYLSKNSIFLFIGFTYLIAVSILNMIFLVGLIKEIKISEAKKRVKLNILMMLINIPIAIIYYIIAMRIFGSIIEGL